VVVYTTSCFEFENDETNEKLSVPPEESDDGSIQPQQLWKEENERTISVSSAKKANVATNPAMPVLRYIPKSRHKNGESPFAEFTNPKGSTKAERKFDEASWHIPKENGVISVHRTNPSKLTKVSLPSFVASSKGSFQEERELSKMCISNGFEPHAHKLMKRSSYDFHRNGSCTQTQKIHLEPAPFITGMGTKTYKKMGMGRVWVLRLKMGLGMGMDS